jgi:hypothetical protein
VSVVEDGFKSGTDVLTKSFHGEGLSKVVGIIGGVFRRIENPE